MKNRSAGYEHEPLQGLIELGASAPAGCALPYRTISRNVAGLPTMYLPTHFEEKRPEGLRERADAASIAMADLVRDAGNPNTPRQSP